MSDEKEIKDRIIKKGEEMFLQFGFSRVTMEELASELGISKKTLYKYYPGKEHLLREIITEIKCSANICTDEIIADTSLDFIQKLKMLMNFACQNANRMKGPLLSELQKNYPDLYLELNEHRKKSITEKFTKIANEGIKTGIFRKDVDKKLVVLIYMNVITGILNPDVLAELPYTGEQVFELIGKVIFEGVLTEEGKQKYHSTKTVLSKH